jgi:hypothetical protein
MVPVSVIWNEAVKLAGNTDEAFVFRRITDAVELLVNKGDFDPLFGLLDICVGSDCCVTLPREVESLLAVNICGNPSVGRHQLYRFHLNTGGDCGPKLMWEWTDLGDACTYRELTSPRKLMAFCAEDEDEDKELWVYGEDKYGNTLRTKLPDGTWQDGYQILLKKTFIALPADAPEVARITRVRKDVTVGPVRLSTIDDDGFNGMLLGVYQWDETEPRYRRIRISQPASWVRIACRRSTYEVRNKQDLLPVKNSMAVVMALRALRLYDKEDFGNAETAESTAVRWLEEEERTSTSENVSPIQVHDETTRLVDPSDYVD